MTSLNFAAPRHIIQGNPDLQQWADSRETTMVVATAIHGIISGNRDAQAIWEDPTAAEWDLVTMAIVQYIGDNDFPPEDRYRWGQEYIQLYKS